MQRGSPHAATAIAAAMVVAGFVVLALSWRGAADTVYIPAQVAYTVSGGATGLALIGAGAAIINVQYTRFATARRSRAMRLLLDGTVDALAALSEGGGRRTAHGARIGDGRRDETHADQRGDDLYRPPSLLAGRSVVHRPGCSRLRGSTKAEPLDWAEAKERGLTPCRVCRPAA